MKVSRLSSLILVFVILIVNIVPVIAAGSTVKLSVDNKTGAATTLTLTGPQRYSLNLKSGKNNYNIVPGNYSYSFYACGGYNYGTLNANKNTNKLTLECGGSAEAGLATLKVNNKSGEEFTLMLTGTGYYYLTVKKGNNTFQVKAGQYSYSYTVCDEQESGNLSVNAKGGKLSISKCKASKAASSQGSKLRVVNATGGTLYIYLSGPNYYSLVVNPGNTTYTVSPGTYSYRISSVCGSTSGTVKINKSLKWTWWCN